MDCLTERQLEVLLHGEAGLRRCVWQRHLDACAFCERRLTQVEANLSFLGELIPKLSPEADAPKSLREEGAAI